MQDDPHLAWNNFVMGSDPEVCEPGSVFRAAAIANRFWGAANNGGLNSFLTDSYDFDATEVVNSLIAVGAIKAAQQLQAVIGALGTPLLKSSQDERWDILDQHWSDDLDVVDVLSEEADKEIQTVLERHVESHEAHYVALPT